LLVAVCYAAYYGINVLIDLLRSPNAGPSDGTETLVLAEAHRPTVISGLGDGEIGPTETYGPEPGGSPESGVAGETTETDGDPSASPEREGSPVAPSPLSGGVEYLDFIKLCRQKAIVAASKHEFA